MKLLRNNERYKNINSEAEFLEFKSDFISVYVRLLILEEIFATSIHIKIAGYLLDIGAFNAGNMYNSNPIVDEFKHLIMARDYGPNSQTNGTREFYRKKLYEFVTDPARGYVRWATDEANEITDKVQSQP